MSLMSRKFLVAALVIACALPVSTVKADAGLLSTHEAMAIESGQALASVDAWLQREEVVAELAALGVDPDMALERAAALSPEELETLAERIDEQPAGAGALEVLGITFLVLLVLDIVGVINIFGIGG